MLGVIYDKAGFAKMILLKSGKIGLGLGCGVHNRNKK